MSEIEFLHQIRPIWLNRITLNLAKASGIRQNVRDQMEDFFDRLEQFLETGDTSWLDPILKSWSEAQTQSDLESGQSDLIPFVESIMLTTHDICREILEPTTANDLMGALLPAFGYAFQTISRFETLAKIDYISNQLDEVRQTLEKLDRSKSDFIAVAAHELKTPLTLIEGYSSMLRDALSNKQFTQEESDLLDGISMGSKRLRSIIDDMIDVSMIDNNLLQLSFQPIWVNRLFAVLETEFQPIIQTRQLTLTLQPFPGSNEMTFGDPERLLQVFRNVLSNAIKFTPDGGRIMVNGRKLPGFLEVIISDSGIGIAPEDQMIIFDKFGRIGNSALHSSSKTKFKGGGPGLGLHIARGIVQSHGGEIWVESPGYDEVTCPGSTFHILIPVHTHPPDDKTAKLFTALQNPT
ncbi:MAG TPA: HAMP domain-containing sensor histidine kinase [Anaerolineaceae bacterium]|jgi:signal transduction histidine kinase|nr:HAMP domain-containing sensor histidine kinase [Anaerolineaceae bacterium]